MESESQAIAVVNCGQLVTLAGPRRARVGGELKDLSIIADAVMLVRNGRIEAIGPREEVEKLKTRGYEVIDAAGRAILPGFVDAHTHPIFAGTRVDEYEL